MKNNMGIADRIIRIILALVIGILFFTHTIEGIAALVLGIIALAFVATSFIGFCPLYLPFGIRTCKKSK